MKTIERETVITVYFGLSVNNDDAFILDDPVLGLLNGAGQLVGDVGTNIRPWVYDLEISRGRSRELDEVQAGMCTVRLRNMDRAFDPLYVDTLSVEDGDVWTTEDDEALLTTGSTLAPLTPGKRVTVQIYGQTIYDGTTEDWNVFYERGRKSTASMNAVDNLGTLARRQLNAHTATGGQTAGERIASVLARPEVNFGYQRDLDDGVSTLQADDVTWKTNALNYLQKVAESDFGLLFASRTNTLTYRDRYSRLMGESAATFSTEGDGFPIAGMEIAVGSELLYNVVGVDREGGTLQTAESRSSQDKYGVRPLALSGLLMDSDEQAQSMAEFLLRLYREPSERVSAVRVNLAALESEADRAQVAALDLGSLVTVRAAPLDIGVVFDQVSVIEGISHTISHGQPHVMTLRLSSVEQWGSVFVLDDAVLGVLDSSASTLAF